MEAIMAIAFRNLTNAELNTNKPAGTEAGGGGRRQVSPGHQAQCKGHQSEREAYQLDGST